MHYNRPTGEIMMDPEKTKAYDREVLLQLLAHEITHAGQNRAFDSAWQNMLVYNNPLSFYENKLGEQQGYDTQSSAYHNILRENAEKAGAASSGRKK
jgi:hypothetical protein